MHLHISKVRWKNLLSTGDRFTEVQLDKAPQTLIIGVNGAGKSTIIEAICFGLFNKSFRKINKPQLLNSINNKHLLVEIEFKANNKNYLIRRGMKPNIFEIYQGTTLLNQSSDNRDYQDYLEKHIIKMSYKSFTQIVILGSSNYTPFMQLPAMARREIIEDLLDIEVFSKMNLVLRDKLFHNRNAVAEADTQFNLANEKLNLVKQHREQLKQDRVKSIEELKTKIRECNTEIQFHSEQSQSKNAKVAELHALIKDEKKVNKQAVELSTVRTSLISKFEKLKKESEFFHDITTCPTCNQGIDDALKCEVVGKKQEQITEIDTAIAQLDDMAKELASKRETFDKISNEIKELNNEILNHNSSINIQQTLIRTYEMDIKKLENVKDENTTNNIKQLQAEVINISADRKELTEHRQTLELAASLLKDTGIKANIIKKYIPVMNKLINKYLAAMDFFVNFELDENFNEVIKSRFRDEFTYQSFSEGERMRLNLALLFAWRSIAKLKNSASCNLLLLDEVMDSSMDSAGTEDFLKIIYNLTSDTNTFIISHKVDQMVDKFPEVIKFTKNGNFSVRE